MSKIQTNSKKVDTESKKSPWLMFRLYSIYISPILFFVIIKNLNISFLSVDSNKYCWFKEFFYCSTKGMLFYENIVCLISLAIILYSIVSWFLLKYKGKNVSDQLHQKTKKIEEWDYDYLPAIVTLMAMVTFDYNSLRGLLFFVLLILFLFLIFAQTTTFYNSALYKAVGLKIYQVDFDNLENCKIITFHKLNGGTTVSLKHIKGNIYFSL